MGVCWHGAQLCPGGQVGHFRAMFSFMGRGIDSGGVPPGPDLDGGTGISRKGDGGGGGGGGGGEGAGEFLGGTTLDGKGGSGKSSSLDPFGGPGGLISILRGGTGVSDGAFGLV